MEITYRLSETEFDQNVFESIKKIFKNRLMKISIVAEETTEIISEQDVYSKIESCQASGRKLIVRIRLFAWFDEQRFF